MNRTGRALALGCLLLAQPLLALADGNSLLIPAPGRCSLDALPADLAQAVAACQQLAQAGDAQAQYELGAFYYDGKGTAQDLSQALNYFEQASLKGHAQAQYRLGLMFFHGEAVPANNVQAYIVLKMAAVNGAEDALDSADEVAEHMSQEEIDNATQVLGQIFRKYLSELQTADGHTPFSPLP
ncbi:tetratricopeptide repeat protein [Pseudomonas typographi]|uniref:Sel1 repeat family protein n=1 Tax=Pseudomonas typographi TaxID=2715964 RepID=A0ABR7Z6D7_9PSED|nr:tetratricopeptide repeat protein [Pseudomonas typographi]MBD1553488.1 sel1 repeat family protein [Pseudomonas typographi]MBD1588975.1 sel1 repeat family protein [Pseudomonas typographi]MBD1600962.1 sel1 repeat family protein [Pseudomonas typographi]